MPKLSVIIPVFNVASYLDGCLASVCGQTFRDMEIIFIDVKNVLFVSGLSKNSMPCRYALLIKRVAYVPAKSIL